MIGVSVPILRFPEFNGEWKSEEVNKLFSHVRNGFVGTATPYYVERGIPYLQSNNIRRNKIDKRKLIYINDEFHKKNRKSVLKKDDILMVQSGHAGECAVVPEEFNNANCHALIVMTPTKQINSDFCAYYMNSSIGKNRIHKLITGQTINHILASDLKNYRIMLPTLIEQSKIASFLSKVDEKIEKLEKKQELWETYKKGIMQQIFSQKLRFKDENGEDYPDWEEKKFETIINYGKAGGTPTSTNKNYYGGQIPFLSISDMTSQGKYIKSTEKLITKAGLNNSSAWIVPENSLLYSIYASVGSVAINKSDISTSQAIFGIILDENIVEIEYIYYYLLDYKKYIHKFIETGTQGNLNAKTVRNLVIKVPSQNEQTKISNYLSFIDIKIEQLSKEVKINKKFKKGLLQQMFC